MANPHPQEWFRNWFDEAYLELYEHRDDREARSFLAHLRDRYGRFGEHGTADLACGAGRHAWVMAGEFGWPVVGVDLSMPLLERAMNRSNGSSSPTPLFVQGDLRAVPLADESVSLVLNVFTSFGYFDTDLEHEIALAEMARVLRPGGLLVLDLMNPRVAVSRLVPEDEKTVGRWQVRQQRRYHPARRRIEKTIQLIADSGQTRTITESVRLFDPEELETRLASAGLRTRERWGDYDGLPFQADTSSRLITLAERP